MPAGERVQYLERLGALTPPPSDHTSTAPPTTTASENWTKLREGWHLALRTQLEDHLQTHNLHHQPQPPIKTLVDGELPHLEDTTRGKWNDRMRRESFWKMIAENYKITASSSSSSAAAGGGSGDDDDHERAVEVVGQETEEVVHY